jgi:cystathionine beta-lyase/cystathionine gamma-synthase
VVKVFLFAESLGGVESLVCHPDTICRSNQTAEERRNVGITDGALRQSVDIEDAEDLIADLDQAAASCPRGKQTDREEGP